MYIPLKSDEAGQGQSFVEAYPDIQQLREAWTSAVDERKWTLAALYQLDLEKRRDQMILHAIERSETRLITAILTSGAVVAVLLAAFIHFTKT